MSIQKALPLVEELRTLEGRIVKGAKILGDVPEWWLSNDPKVLAAESLFHKLSDRHTELTDTLFCLWKTEGFRWEWCFSVEDAVQLSALPAGHWTQDPDGSIRVRWTYAEFALCMRLTEGEP